VGVCWIVKSEGRLICFKGLISTDCVLRRLSEELTSLVFLALSTWRTIRNFMAFEGSSWPLVRFEDLPRGITDEEGE
jgi:hypothetical protein